LADSARGTIIQLVLLLLVCNTEVVKHATSNSWKLLDVMLSDAVVKRISLKLIIINVMKRADQMTSRRLSSQPFEGCSSLVEKSASGSALCLYIVLQQGAFLNIVQKPGRSGTFLSTSTSF
jgi:vesicle coat complex subunit